MPVETMTTDDQDDTTAIRLDTLAAMLTGDMAGWALILLAGNRV